MVMTLSFGSNFSWSLSNITVTMNSTTTFLIESRLTWFNKVLLTHSFSLSLPTLLFHLLIHFVFHPKPTILDNFYTTTPFIQSSKISLVTNTFPSIVIISHWIDWMSDWFNEWLNELLTTVIVSPTTLKSLSLSLSIQNAQLQMPVVWKPSLPSSPLK